MAKAGLSAQEQRAAVFSLVAKANSIGAGLKLAAAQGADVLCNALSAASSELEELSAECDELIGKLEDEIEAVDVEISEPPPARIAALTRCNHCKALGYAIAYCKSKGHAA